MDASYRSLVSFLLLGTILFIASCFFVLSAKTVHAQSILGQEGLNLIVTPDLPKPNEKFQVSLDDYSLDTLGATITWMVDGVEQKQVKNERSIELVAKGFGKKTVVSVLITSIKYPALSASVTVIPFAVDLILESNSYIPPFYKGKALLSGDSIAHATAIVNDGETNHAGYSYKWTKDMEVLFGGPVKGKTSADFLMPRYDGGRITVEIFNAQGEFVGRKTAVLNPVEPEIHFYEMSPLRGLTQREVTDPYPLTKDQVTLYAEPFFLNTSLSSETVDLTWKLGNTQVASAEKNINAITLGRAGDSAQSLLQCSIVTKNKIPQFVNKTFTISF